MTPRDAAGVSDWAAADRPTRVVWDRLLQVNLASAAVLTPLVLELHAQRTP